MKGGTGTRLPGLEVETPTAQSGIRSRRLARLAGYGVLLLAPLAGLVVVMAFPPLTDVGLLLVGVIAAALVLLLLPPTGLTVAKTWTVGYLLVQFPIRSLFLLSRPVKEPPPIYRLYVPGVGGDTLLRQALSQVLLGLLVLTAAYLVTMRLSRTGRPVQLDARLRRGWLYALLALAVIGLPAEMATGAMFLITLPGLFAAGAGAFVCYAFARNPRKHFLPFVLVLCYEVVRVVLLHSKLALLAAVTGLAVGFAVSSGQRDRRRRILRMTAVTVVSILVALLVFAASIPGNGGGVGGLGEFGKGASAVVSRSYGVDALMVSNYYLNTGGEPLNGSSMTDLLSSWIPRALWPDKPLSFSQRFGEEIFYFSPLAGQSFFAPSYPGEWLLNFGSIGLLAGWLLLGILLGRVDSMPSIAHRVLWLTVCVHLVEGSLVAQFWLAVPFLLGGYLVAEPGSEAEA
jgi:oligosaccharide repeat unit polymerase